MKSSCIRFRPAVLLRWKGRGRKRRRARDAHAEHDAASGALPTPALLAQATHRPKPRRPATHRMTSDIGLRDTPSRPSDGNPIAMSLGVMSARCRHPMSYAQRNKKKGAIKRPVREPVCVCVWGGRVVPGGVRRTRQVQVEAIFLGDEALFLFADELAEKGGHGRGCRAVVAFRWPCAPG